VPVSAGIPLVGVAAITGLAHRVIRQRDGMPFYMAALTFAAAFGTPAISFWSYMNPFSITIG
jgi:cytochrome d ubiquinol oxidase subunit II